jgi:hypothetical protein
VAPLDSPVPEVASPLVRGSERRAGKITAAVMRQVLEDVTHLFPGHEDEDEAVAVSDADIDAAAAALTSKLRALDVDKDVLKAAQHAVMPKPRSQMAMASRRTLRNLR